MTDHFGATDRVADTLTALRADTDRLALPDSGSVRRRGEVRTRNQVVGSALAVAALAAGALGVAGSLSGSDRSIEGPPATRGPSVTAAPQPQGPVGTDVLLPADAVPPVPAQDFKVGETLDDVTAADAAERFLTVCRADITGGGDVGSAVARTYYTDLDATAWHWVARYATPAAAQQAVAQLGAGCTAAEGVDVTPLADSAATPMPGVTDAFRAAQFSADPGSEFNGELVGVARRGTDVTVVGLRGMLREGDVDVADVDTWLARAAEALGTR